MNTIKKLQSKGYREADQRDLERLVGSFVVKGDSLKDDSFEGISLMVKSLAGAPREYIFCMDKARGGFCVGVRHAW